MAIEKNEDIEKEVDHVKDGESNSNNNDDPNDNIDNNSEDNESSGEGILDLVNGEKYSEIKTDLEKKVAVKIHDKIQGFKQDFLDTVRGKK